MVGRERNPTIYSSDTSLAIMSLHLSLSLSLSLSLCGQEKAMGEDGEEAAWGTWEELEKHFGKDETGLLWAAGRVMTRLHPRSTTFQYKLNHSSNSSSSSELMEARGQGPWAMDEGKLGAAAWRWAWGLDGREKATAADDSLELNDDGGKHMEKDAAADDSLELMEADSTDSKPVRFADFSDSDSMMTQPAKKSKTVEGVAWPDDSSQPSTKRWRLASQFLEATDVEMVPPKLK